MTALLALAHELGRTLGEVEQMTPDEIHLHLKYMEWRGKKEKDALDDAKSRQKMKPVASFKRR